MGLKNGPPILSDVQARDFIAFVLAKQRSLEEISIPYLKLKGDTICTLLYSVILKAPGFIEDPDTGSGNETFLRLRKSEDLTEFTGCYKTLKVLNLAGNNLDSTHLDANTFFSIFDFVENLEELNIECLKFESFKIFKQQFLMDFVSN